MKYSEDQLVALAKNNVDELVRLLNTPSTYHVILTFGTEILASEISDEQIVLPVLKKLLKHINALVREGAIIGVLSFYSKQIPPIDILNSINYIANNDPSISLRSFAKDSLQELEEKFNNN